MTWVQIVGIICGCVALFCAFAAGLTYFKLRKLFTLIDESQYEEIMPFVEKQRKRVYIEGLLCAFLTLVTLALTIINSI